MISSEAMDRTAVAAGSPGEVHRHDIPALTGLRFVAAFSVLVAHSFSTILLAYETPMGAVYWMRQASGFGMTLFFVLSGFVIHYNYATMVTEGGLRGVAAYLWARFARLYPLFLMMMFVYVLLSSRHFDFWTGHPERFNSTLRALPYFLLSVQSWFYVPIEGNSLISAIGGGSPLTWSISTEWFFYFSYPCVAWAILRSRGPWITAAAAALWCVLWMTIASRLYDSSVQLDEWAVAHFGPVAGMQTHLQDSFVRWLLYFSPYLRIGEFVLGALMAQLYLLVRSRRITGWENAIGSAIFLAAAVSVLVVTYLGYSSNAPANLFRKTSTNFALAPTAALLIFTAARYRNVGSRILSSRALIALGEASYSTYLVHYVVLMMVMKATSWAAHGIIVDVILLVLVVTGILLMSIVLYRYYEAPARRWLRRRWGNLRLPGTLADTPRARQVS